MVGGVDNSGNAAQYAAGNQDNRTQQQQADKNQSKDKTNQKGGTGSTSVVEGADGLHASQQVGAKHDGDGGGGSGSEYESSRSTTIGKVDPVTSKLSAQLAHNATDAVGWGASPSSHGALTQAVVVIAAPSNLRLATPSMQTSDAVSYHSAGADGPSPQSMSNLATAPEAFCSLMSPPASLGSEGQGQGQGGEEGSLFQTAGQFFPMTALLESHSTLEKFVQQEVTQGAKMGDISNKFMNAFAGVSTELSGETLQQGMHDASKIKGMSKFMQVMAPIMLVLSIVTLPLGGIGDMVASMVDEMAEEMVEDATESATKSATEKGVKEAGDKAASSSAGSTGSSTPASSSSTTTDVAQTNTATDPTSTQPAEPGAEGPEGTETGQAESDQLETQSSDQAAKSKEAAEKDVQDAERSTRKSEAKDRKEQDKSNSKDTKTNNIMSGVRTASMVTQMVYGSVTASFEHSEGAIEKNIATTGAIQSTTQNAFKSQSDITQDATKIQEYSVKALTQELAGIMGVIQGIASAVRAGTIQG